MLKCLTGRFSSISARTRSFLGLPRPRAAGALDLTLPLPALGRTSWLSTSSSCRREQGAQVQPYPLDGLATSGGWTHRMWNHFLQRSHDTESELVHCQINFRRIRQNTCVGHQSLQLSQRRMLSVRSGMTSFSATTYSYLETSTSRMLSGTIKPARVLSKH